jgi:hypothetical protein
MKIVFFELNQEVVGAISPNYRRHRYKMFSYSILNPDRRNDGGGDIYAQGITGSGLQ